VSRVALAPGRRVRVSVPATSANLGPGFDAFGLALSLRDELTVEVVEAGVHVEVNGEDDGSRGEANLIARAVAAGLALAGASAPGLALTCENRIPHGRGLGSSAAAIVAGVLAGAHLGRPADPGDPDPDPSDLTGGPAKPPVPHQEIFRVAHELEGHPDNVAAALYGGFTVAWVPDSGPPGALRADPPAAVLPVLYVPTVRQLTAQARAALPERIPHVDAAGAVGRASALALLLAGGRPAGERPAKDAAGAPSAQLSALSALSALLMELTADRLHQPYRLPAAPATAALVTTVRAAGIPAVLSGSGPTVLALAAGPADRARAARLVPEGFTAHLLDVEQAGARVEEFEEAG